MELIGKNIAILVDISYQEMEVWYPFYRFQEAVSADDFDGVVVPGGYAPDHIRRHAKANQFVKDMDAQGKLVASICHGPWVLCSADILRGRRATCFFAIKDDVVNAGALYEDAEVVVDRNLVTSRKPEDLPAFCKASIRVLVELPVLTA
jgi:protease I